VSVHCESGDAVLGVNSSGREPVQMMEGDTVSSVPSELRYAKSHEWVKVDGNRARVGISDFAQGELGDVVALYLPKVGESVSRGDKLAEVDSMKTSDVIYAPVSGVIVEVNQALDESPETVNEDPYGEGWLVVIEMKDPDEVNSLLTAQQYTESIEEGA
jgi:glycine cleavage system H protein